MLKSIYVDGLKSLCDFKLELQPGLNVLIGHNGSGKSNILTAIAFISSINRLGHLNDAYGNVEGLFDVLRKNNTMKFAVTGELGFQRDSIVIAQECNDNFFDLQYTYECEIAFQPTERERLSFSKQVLEIELGRNAEGTERSRLRLEYENNALTTCSLDENLVDEKLPTSNYETYFKFRSKSLNRKSIIHQFLNEIVPMELILQDLSTDFFDIEPYYVRSNIEKTGKSSITPSGEGLSGVLLDIVNKKDRLKNNETASDGRNYADIHEKIVTYFRMLAPELIDLEVSFNSEKREIESYAIFERNGGRKVRIPLKRMSDGVLKWLSLITILLTTNKTLLLEEPENFLDPSLQAEFIRLTRTMLEYGQKNAVISTHSESVINSLETSEVIITAYLNGRTHARPIEIAEEVKKSLQESDLGLGWYYRTGSLNIESDVR